MIASSSSSTRRIASTSISSTSLRLLLLAALLLLVTPAAVGAFAAFSPPRSPVRRRARISCDLQLPALPAASRAGLEDDIGGGDGERNGSRRDSRLLVAPETATTEAVNRRSFVGSAFFGTAVAASSLALVGRPSSAAAAEEAAANPFDAVRFELNDPSGGVAYMQKCVDSEDFPALMEFTKMYDQVLRKRDMGKAKKTLPKDLRAKATEACNAVTFDLIGMNRSSRPGQENIDDARKYLEELRRDVQTLLDMEGQAAAE